MSRSNPTPTNPAKRFLKWSGSRGELYYYDKEKQEEVVVKLPFTFLVLDQLSTISGFCEQDNSQYWANEVRSVAKEEFTVKTSKGPKQTGLYKDLADVRAKGAKYAKSIYIAYFDIEANGLVIGNLRASGAALTAWIEFSNKNVVQLGKCTLTGSAEAKKGATKFFVPTFEWGNADTADDDIAKELDLELQQYLNQYLEAAKFDRSQQVPLLEEGSTAADRADLDRKLEQVIDEGEPIDLNDIPF